MQDEQSFHFNEIVNFVAAVPTAQLQISLGRLITLSTAVRQGSHIWCKRNQRCWYTCNRWFKRKPMIIKFQKNSPSNQVGQQTLSTEDVVFWSRWSRLSLVTYLHIYLFEKNLFTPSKVCCCEGPKMVKWQIRIWIKRSDKDFKWMYCDSNDVMFVNS